MANVTRLKSTNGLIFASYKDPNGFRIDLAHGDVFDLNADSLVFGATRSIRERIVTAGAQFEIARLTPQQRSSLWPNRELYVAKTRMQRWANAYSVQYRTRNVDPNSIHAQHLAMGIYQTLAFYVARLDDSPHVALVPFGWREPSVIVYATLAAMLQTKQPFIPFPRRVTICALSGLDAFASVLDNDREFRQCVNGWTIRPTTIPRRRTLFTRVRTQGGG